MIKANELRVGNTIESSIGDEWHEYSVTADTIQNFSYDPFDVANKFNRPVPLTPEIWRRCGFEFNQKHCFWSIGNFRIVQWCDNIYKLSDDLEVRLDYLHQLQNLYFSLTGEELVLKEP